MASKQFKHLHRVVFDRDQLGLSQDVSAGGGVGWGYTQTLCKAAWDGSPYCISNEFIAAEIGRFLRLPIPSYAVMRIEREAMCFGSLDFNFDRDQLPPILPEPCWQHLPFECTGVLFFDILIANADRHDENLLVDNGLKPKRMIVFDHDQSLFGGGGSLRGQERLDAIMTRLGVSGGPVTSGNRHCLLDGANTREYFGEWLKRIGSLPDWFIEDVCTEAQTYGITKEESEAAVSFLEYRKSHLERIIEEHREEFRGIQNWQDPGRLF